MKYSKADTVLPNELIALIQDYVDGQYLYIPRKQENERHWGEVSGAKRELQKRNHEIYCRYKSGITVATLAEEYYLSDKTIHKIISRERRK